MNRLHHLHGAEMTWQTFVIEFEKEYISQNYKKGKQDAFFRLTQGSVSVGKSRLAIFEGTSFRGLVDKSVEIESLHKEERKIIQRSRKQD
ncbi:conserved hypothetical protein [Ricinus communis]|uniref:Retrotransposon gag domain-containing protein n=1 Tax=Ricinus communis TaxID=3988 RepID=B9SN20_RICCO|nr:conserved hypothetical protein [Ricinus communis]